MFLKKRKFMRIKQFVIDIVYCITLLFIVIGALLLWSALMNYLGTTKIYTI